ncbi:MAG: molybdopterin cofactor-binding domain-containing protein, partial [Pyrinomonadaceae bacterium]
MSATEMKRRDFLKTGAALGGGLLLSLYVPEWILAESVYEATPLTRNISTFVPNAFVRIGTDNIVTVIVNKSEMGQGVYTSLPMMVAEELEADWSKVRYEPAPVDQAYAHPVFGIQMTGGSTSTASEWDRFRQAGATARMMLIGAAAKNWKVDPASLRAENGHVINPA